MKGANHSAAGIVVAIDGPAGAGKSTVSRRVAQELGYQLLDTGAIYRAVAYCARERGVSWDDPTALGQLAGGLSVRFFWDGDSNRIVVDGNDISTEIRTAEISQGASIVSQHPPVRAALLDLQRRLGEGGGVVAEGRDIGTVVFPRAAAKFFLTASPEVRAQRRCDELGDRGESTDFAATLAEIQERDDRDSNRAVAPLKRADDAVSVDSSAVDIEAVVEQILNTVRSRLR